MEGIWPLIGIIALLFLLWIFTGGPTRPISFEGPFITPITNINQKQYGYGSLSTTTSNYSGTSYAYGSDHLAQGQTEAQYNATFGDSSPYRGVVEMDPYVNGTGNPNPNDEYIAIRLSSDAKNPVDITGWRIESTVTFNNATIGYGTKTISQSTNNLTDIILEPGDVAYLVTGVSPVDNSFEENECMGYFGSQVFVPSLSSECPTPVSEFNTYYPGNPLADDSCYALMENTRLCSIPPAPPTTETPDCTTFVETHLNYNGCVTTHAGGSGFLDHVWYIYLNHGSRLWKDSRDNIKLLDASGKTVDMFTY